MKTAVVVFPGSNCDQDALHALRDAGATAELVWHGETALPGFDAVVLPGGFAHGDYLRSGAIARFSPVMKAVERFAADGRPVLGICNGFQVLVEAGLLPGALLRNTTLRFVHKLVTIRVESVTTPFTRACSKGQRLRMPIAHNEGNYFCEPDTLRRLAAEDRVVFRYCDAAGEAHADANPNGSIENIAGICSEARNVVGLMPHPERACEALLGSTDGGALFRSLLAASLSGAAR